MLTRDGHCGVKTAFTLIELLAVAICLAVMMAIATPLYLSAVANAQMSECRSNMQTIANIEREYKIQSATHTYTTSLTTLSAQMPTVPVCPSGGTYTITISSGTATAQNGQTVPNGGLVVSCSASGHGKFAPGIDQN